MGEASNRKKRILAEHPYCCFCGGGNEATTVDHVPNRACFPGKVGPEGFEFPACGRCQNGLRSEEHFFAFFIRMGDRDNGNYDQETSKRLIRGIANNMPELLPDLRLSPVEKRKALRDFGLTKPRSLSLDQIKMAAFPRNIDPVIRKAASKLALALFSKHKKKAAREDYFIGAYWTQTANKKVMTDWMSLIDDLTAVEIGQRSNTDLGNRFRYRWAIEQDGEPEIFAAIVQFGDGLVLYLTVTEEAFWDADDEPAVDYIQVRNLVSQDYRESWMRLNQEAVRKA